MPQTPAARRYAKALLDLAQTQKAEETISGELSQIVTAIADRIADRVADKLKKKTGKKAA